MPVLSHCLSGAALVVALLVSAVASSSAQQTTAAATNAQVHPELVDSTWGRRVGAAWQLALARRSTEARQSFESLHREQPMAIEPMIGLGFIARAAGDRSTALRWFRDALAVEPTSANAREQLTATEWDRPKTFDLVVGAARIGSSTVSNWDAGFNIPVNASVTVNARGGQIGAGDPLRGIFLDSANGGGARASFVSGGAGVRFADRFSLAGRATHWTAPDQSNTLVYVDASARVSSRFTARVGARPMGGIGAPQVSAAADMVVATGHALTIEGVQGFRATQFEARSAIRGFYTATPSVRRMYGVGVVREIDTRNAATTVALSATEYFKPYFGIRLGGSVRRGAFERSAADVGVVFRP